MNKSNIITASFAWIMAVATSSSLILASFIDVLASCTTPISFKNSLGTSSTLAIALEASVNKSKVSGQEPDLDAICLPSRVINGGVTFFAMAFNIYTMIVTLHSPLATSSECDSI